MGFHHSRLMELGVGNFYHIDGLLQPMSVGKFYQCAWLTQPIMMGLFNWCQWVTATKDGLLQPISMWVISTNG